MIVSVAVLPIAVVLLYNLVTLRQSQEREIHAEALRMAQLVSLEMNQIVLGAESLLRAVATAPVVRQSDGAGCSAYLAGILEQLPQYASIAIIDGAGIVRCMPGETRTEIYVGDRSYFTEVRRTGDVVVGEFIEGRVSMTPMLPIAIPLTASARWKDGVVVAGLDLGWLGARLKERDFAPQSAITIADRNGRILAREPMPEDFVGTVIPDAFQHLVRASAPGTLEVTSQDGTRRVIGYYPATAIPVGLYVSAGMSTEVAFAPLNLAALRSVLITLASIFAAFFLAWTTSDVFIRRPFRELRDTIAAWRRGDVGARTGMTRRDGEMGQVGQAIDGFMDELLAARALRAKAEAQRELMLGELDHRVKNLIASVQAVARQSFRHAEEPEIAQIFLDRLTTMSKAHSLLMRDEWQEATVGDLVATTIAPFDDPEHPQFTVTGPMFTLNSKAILALGMALHELCTNAVKYGALQQESGRVTIDWETAPAAATGEATFRLIWREQGGPPVAAPGGKGFGSRMIEQALAQQIGGEVTVAYPPEGVICTVTAPVSIVGATRNAAA